MSSNADPGAIAFCVENGIWTPVPLAPPHKPGDFILHLKDHDALLLFHD